MPPGRPRRPRDEWPTGDWPRPTGTAWARPVRPPQNSDADLRDFGRLNRRSGPPEVLALSPKSRGRRPGLRHRHSTVGRFTGLRRMP